MGGYIFGKNDKGGYNASDVGLNKPGAVDAVTYLKKFYADDVFPAGIIGDNGLNAIDSLFTEKKRQPSSTVRGRSSRMKRRALTTALRRCRRCRTVSQ